MELLIRKVSDFSVSGDGAHANWQVADWQPLTRVGTGQLTYQTKAKALYSDTGIYFLIDCQDRQLTCTHTQDNVDLFKEDVLEIFLWPDQSNPLYLEYELSPLGYELPLLVANHHGAFAGWLPWHYEGKTKIQKATTVRGGPKTSMAQVTGWTAECHIPFALLKGLCHLPPRPGTTWRGNIFRIDYDANPNTQWAWCPDTGSEFHAFEKFGALRFI